MDVKVRSETLTERDPSTPHFEGPVKVLLAMVHIDHLQLNHDEIQNAV